MKNFHPTLGPRCFGKNLNPAKDDYCKDCESRSICEMAALDEFAQIAKDYKQMVSERGPTAG